MNKGKSIASFFYTLLLFFFTSITVLAGSGDPVAEVSVANYFITIPALCGLVLIVTQFLKLKLDIQGSIVQYLSWFVAIVLSAVGWLFELGMFLQLEWYYIFIYGFACGLITNGLADWTMVHAILKFFNFYKEKG